MIIDTLMSLNWIDYAIIGIIGVSVLIGLSRGFIREAISLATWVVAFWVAFKFSGVFADYLSDYIKTASIRHIICFAVLFIGILILGALLNFFLSKFISYTGLGGTDKLLGMLFGILRGILLIAILILLVEITTFVNDPWWQQSVLVSHFSNLVAWLHGFLPAELNRLNGIT
jgi:membrane protein required for colicin V production